jgi:recombination protein RecA
MARKSKHVEHDTQSIRDDLAILLQKELNKAQKDGGKIAYFLDEQDDPSKISDWISTGSTLLDLAISNRPNGGLPVGRVIEFSGLEGTGKSLLCAHIVANTQKKGGQAVFMDTENSAAPEFWKAVGVDIKNLLYVPLTTIEEIFANLEKCIAIVRKSDKDKLLTVIVDSVAGASTDSELESDHGVSGYNTTKAIVVSKAMRKIINLLGEQRICLIFTNQLRFNMGAGVFGDKWITPTGKAIPFHSSVRIRLASVAKLKNAKKVVIGNACQAQVIKNKVGPPHRVAKFDIYYDSGISDISSWLSLMKTDGLVNGAKGSYTFTRKDGQEVKFNTSKFVELVNNEPSFKEEIYNKICDTYITSYKDKDSEIKENLEEVEGIADEADPEETEVEVDGTE